MRITVTLDQKLLKAASAAAGTTQRSVVLREALQALIERDATRRDGAVRMPESSLVLCHPFVVGELACGHLRDHAEVLDALEKLPRAPITSHNEALVFLNRHGLAGRSIGRVDVRLLAGTALAGSAYL